MYTYVWYLHIERYVHPFLFVNYARIPDHVVCLIILGMECDAFDNPADFFLDKLNEAENDLQPPNPEST